MDAIVQKYATAAVPRYTSYPTVPHFEKDFPEATVRGWLEQLDPAQAISLYLHVPFCRQLCWYCGCNMKLASRYEPVAKYVDVLAQEVDLVTGMLPARMRVEHLHWGGGTPTALEPDDLERMMARVASRFDFEPDAEIAVESDPRTLTDEMIRRIGAIGFNRASFGVQEFDSRVQAAINRIQPPDMVARSVEALREAGVRGINFDLIYGLPHQTVASLSRTIEQCVAMRPDRIALFGYAHVPWMAKKQRLIDEALLPGPLERRAQAEAAAVALAAAGYEAIGIDHFALPHDPLAAAARAGTLHRNFQGYTTDEANTLIGLGATSIGRTPWGYVQNISETGAWARTVTAGRLPVAKGHELTADDRARAHVIEQLMCQGTADLEAARRAFGQPYGWCDDALSNLAGMVDDALVEVADGTVRLNDAARPLARVAAAAFDRYFQSARARHSVAV
jgi:oxygen-independent coproporphyrinogen-3 oxidase